MGDLASAVKQLLSTTLGVSLSRIGDDAVRGKLRGWDSMGHVALITAIEDRFAVKFDDAEIIRMASLSDILQLLRTKGVSVGA